MPHLFKILLPLFLALGCRPALAQTPLDNYLDQRIERHDFSKDKWKSLSKGIDYTKEKKPKKKEPQEPRGSSLDAETAAVIKWRIIGIGIAALIFLIVKMAGGEELFRPGNRKLKPATGKITLEQIEENLHEAELQDPIRQAVLAGDFVLAVRLYYLALLKELSLKKHIRWKRDKTNGEYLRELAESPLFSPVQEATLIFERVWYGEVKLERADFQAVEIRFLDAVAKVQ